MPEQLLHIYGPFSIHSFGLFVSFGFLLSCYFFEKKIHQNKALPNHLLSSFIILCVSAALLGSRLLFHLQNPIDINKFFSLWTGGFSLLGGLITALSAMIIFLRYHRIAIFPVLDSIAIYFPLFQSIARLGCFFAGCCYGHPTNVFWSVTYTKIDSLAPLHIALHPTQLYSVFLLLCIFIIVHYIYKYYYHIPGVCSTVCLILIGCERIFIDFFRNDREFFTPISNFLSLHQIIALLIIISAATSFIYYQQKKHPVWPTS